MGAFTFRGRIEAPMVMTGYLAAGTALTVAHLIVDLLHPCKELG